MALLAFFFCQRLIWLLALVVWNGSQYSQSSLLSWILKGVEFASIGYTLLLYMNFTLWSGRRGKRFSHWFCFWNDSLFDLFFNFILISKKAEIRIFIVVELFKNIWPGSVVYVRVWELRARMRDRNTCIWGNIRYFGEYYALLHLTIYTWYISPPFDSVITVVEMPWTSNYKLQVLVSFPESIHSKQVLI